MSELTLEDRDAVLERLNANRDVHEVTVMYSELIEKGVDPVQICRTCSKTDPQRIKVSLKEMISLKKENNGVLPESALCHPNVSEELRNVRSDRTITPLRADGKVLVQLQTKTQRAESVAYIDSCGQNIQDKCRGCSRLNRINARVKGGTNANGHPYFVEVLIGGHCTIPAEGIVVDGEVTMCDKKPYSRDPLGLSRSCGNCKWRSAYSEPSMLDHVTPLRWGLTSYEREKAMEGVDPDQIGIALNEASRARGKIKVKAGPRTNDSVMSWAGMIKYFNLSIVRMYEDDEGKPFSVDVRIPTTGDIFNFKLAEGDDSIGMIKIVDTKNAILEITSPHHRQYGLPDRNRISYPRSEELVDCDKCNGNKSYPSFNGSEWKDIPCQQCGGTGKVGAGVPSNIVTVEDNSDLVDPYCTQCHGKIPCYHHLRQPMLRESRSVVRLLNGVIETEHTTFHSYMRKDSRHVIQVEPDENKLVLKRDGSHVWVENSAGNAPSFVLFRIRVRSIMDWCKNSDERRQVLKQFADTKNKIAHGPDRLIDYSWSKPAPVPAFHAFCSLNLYDQEHGHPTVKTFNDQGESAGLVSTARGIDFAQEWNDEFGTPRDQISTNRIMESFGRVEILLDPKFSWAKAQENEEWMRVHSTGEIIQDEFIASLHQLIRGRKSENGVEFPGMPKDAVVVDLGVGIPNTSIILNSTEDAINWLSEEIVMPGNDEAKGFKTTRRWAALGYENFRNTKRLQEGDINSVFEFSKRDAMSDKEDDEARVGFYACTRCYDPTDEGDAGKYYPYEVSTIDLSCPNPECDGLLFFMPSEEHRQGHMRATNDQIEPDEPYRRRSGSADSSSWQQSERLQSMSCPNWQPRRGW